MRKGSTQLTLDIFERWMSVYLDILDKVYDSPTSEWPQEKKREIHEAFVFKIVSLWEVMVEDLMVDCLNRDSSQYAQFMDLRIRKHIPRDECRALIQGLGYFDAKSVEQLKELAANILPPASNPFASIPPGAGQKINEFVAMRNYLAHYSAPAKRRLERIYRRYQLKRFPEPGPFLMARVRGSSQTRFGDYFDAFQEAISALRLALGLPNQP